MVTDSIVSDNVTQFTSKEVKGLGKNVYDAFKNTDTHIVRTLNITILAMDGR